MEECCRRYNNGTIVKRSARVEAECWKLIKKIIVVLGHSPSTALSCNTPKNTNRQPYAYLHSVSIGYMYFRLTVGGWRFAKTSKTAVPTIYRLQHDLFRILLLTSATLYSFVCAVNRFELVYPSCRPEGNRDKAIPVVLFCDHLGHHYMYQGCGPSWSTILIRRHQFIDY